MTMVIYYVINGKKQQKNIALLLSNLDAQKLLCYLKDNLRGNVFRPLTKFECTSSASPANSIFFTLENNSSYKNLSSSFAKILPRQ